MPKCIVRDCVNSSFPVKSTTWMFTVPLKPENRRRSWLKACKREDISLYSSVCVCELHFDVNVFFKNPANTLGFISDIHKWLFEICNLTEIASNYQTTSNFFRHEFN